LENAQRQRHVENKLFSAAPVGAVDRRYRTWELNGSGVAARRTQLKSPAAAATPAPMPSDKLNTADRKN